MDLVIDRRIGIQPIDYSTVHTCKCILIVLLILKNIYCQKITVIIQYYQISFTQVEFVWVTFTFTKVLFHMTPFVMNEFWVHFMILPLQNSTHHCLVAYLGMLLNYNPYSTSASSLKQRKY